MFERMQRRPNGERWRFVPGRNFPPVRPHGGARAVEAEPEPGIPLDHDVLGALLAEDARNTRREWRLGLIAASCWIAALVTGVAIPALAAAFAFAPVVALVMELLARDETM
ncbi:hypothetical protein EOD42_05885 [Rhodovarius crocodyli]|uniref:Uncharacterized protein n=1 Tax=Rhodovarius crocodyli TaxID=1979269 RepID=A0A437MPP3_9PROT|nr:hypothetical protein [Rhodovarius crocodyli]RVT99608.1 hypothetical protein EOD42_05885 [Rhodovarius crocodyli]